MCILYIKINLLVNNYVVWKINDSLLFLKSVQNEKGALLRIEDIIYSLLRSEVGLYNFSEIISEKNDEISNNITKKAGEILSQIGVDIIDVQIKRVSFPSQNLESVYRRMIAERKRIADKFRSEGQGEASKILGDKERELLFIQSEAYKQAEIIRGKADGKAGNIYAAAYNQSADSRDFYKFLKYKRAF